MGEYENQILKEKNGTYQNCVTNIVLYLENDDNFKDKFTVQGKTLLYEGNRINPLVTDKLKNMICERFGFKKVKDKDIKDSLIIVEEDVLKTEIEKRKSSKLLDDMLDGVISDEHVIDNKWWKGIIDVNWTDNGPKFIHCIKNYENCISHVFGDKLKFNNFTQLAEYEGDKITSLKVSKLYREIEESIRNVDFSATINQTVANHGINNQCVKVIYNPVTDYLNSLKWDGVKRLETIFIDWLGAEDNYLNRKIALMWFRGAVMRAFEPGCKFDYMPILYSSRGGTGKSTFTERLCRVKEYYCSNFNFNNKDRVDIINGSWICNNDELANMNKSDIEDYKSWLTTTVNKARLSYDKRSQDFLVHCVYIGSTNKKEFLRDNTSDVERRFIPIICTEEYSNGIRLFNEFTDDVVDNYWAEAMHYYKEDFEKLGKGRCGIYLNEEDIELLTEMQWEFKSWNNDDRITTIREWLDGYYKLNDAGEFESFDDFYEQVTGVTQHTGNLHKINCIPTVWIAEAYKKKSGYNTVTTNYIRDCMKREWWSDKCKYYNNKQYKGWVLFRSKIDNSTHNNVVNNDVNESLPF